MATKLDANRFPKTKLNVNGKEYEVAVHPDSRLLWVIREELGLTGTKFGCGIARCGACTVLLDGKEVRSCTTPVSKAAGKEIVTIEGLSADGYHFVQKAWIEEDVPQCGYCHSGQIMSAAALLEKNPKPTDADIDAAMSGNVCRCGTYQRIRLAIHRAARMKAEEKTGGSHEEGGGTRRQAGQAGGTGASGLVLGLSGQGKEVSGESSILNPFVRIGTDDTITIVVNHSEMGQGVCTSLPMLVAEELECDWTKIRVEFAPVDPAYNHTLFGFQGTGGSTSILSEWERLRHVGATAREMLIAAAADEWKVEKGNCRAENGMVLHPSGKKLSYGTLAGKAAKMAVPENVSLKDPSAFTVLGKPTKRLDTPQKVTGEAVFGLDVTIPDMLVALVARPPVFGASVVSFDAEKAKAVPGVEKVVEVPFGVAVAGSSFWSAKAGRDALDITWDEGPNAEISTEAMREQYASLAQTPGTVARKEGDPQKFFPEAATQLIAEYEVPYLAHAAMEPLNCVVDLREDGCDIWTGTQFQTVDRTHAARVSGLKPEQIRIHTTFLGGGFGRRANPQSDFVVQAVEVAKAVKAPVKVIWTREDDMKAGWYRPMWYDRIAGALDANGDPIAWQHTVVGQSIAIGTPFEGALMRDGVDLASVEGAEDMPYEIPNILVDLHSPEIGVPVQWWRSVGHSHTAFVVESFLDELATSAGKDPYEFRRNLLKKSPRHRAVLELAAEKAGWGSSLPEGHGRGLAVHQSFGSWVAQVAEVSVSEKGVVQVHRVVCAIDCGSVVNPDTVEAQMEGGIVFGLTAALHGAITLENGRVQQGNFHDYPMLVMKEMPKVEVFIVQGSEPPGGVGEPGVPPIAPAVANAVFAATGKRIRRLPMSPDELKEK